MRAAPCQRRHMSGQQTLPIAQSSADRRQAGQPPGEQGLPALQASPKETLQEEPEQIVASRASYTCSIDMSRPGSQLPHVDNLDILA